MSVYESELRDGFAKVAFELWLSKALSPECPDPHSGKADDSRIFDEHAACVADICYRYADAMMKRRQKRRVPK